MVEPLKLSHVPGFSSVQLVVVEDGTVITDDVGNEAIVNDKTLVGKRDVYYCTKRVFDAVKSQTSPLNRDAVSPTHRSSQ